MNRKTVSALYLALPAALSALLPSTTIAAEHDAGREAPEGHHEAGHSYHKNVIAGFIGGTHEERRENATTLGIEYERRLNASFGVGAIVEHAFGDLDFWIYAIPFAFHSGAWKFYVAPGIEDGDRDSEPLVRVGAEYGFQFGTWEIAPQLDFDFVDGDSVAVFGVTFAKGF